MPNENKYEHQGTELDSPASSAVVITPHDSTDLVKPSRGIYVGVGGDISVEMAGTGTAIVFVGVAAGTVLPFRVTRVNATATTATNLVSVY